MTPDEETLLRNIGVLLLGDLAGFTAMTLVYGVFVLLFSISTHKILKRGIKSNPNFLLFLTSLLTFLISTLYWSAYLASFATLVREMLVNTDIGPLDTGGSFDGIDSKVLRFSRIQNWTATVLPMISDAVVVWRAWEICSDRRWIIFGPIVLLIGTVGAGLGYLGVVSSEPLNIVGGLGGTPTWKNTFISFLTFSLVVNVVSTAFIIYKLWYSRRVPTAVPSAAAGKKISKSQVVTIVLIDSGLLYAATQVVNFVLELVKPIPNSSLYFSERVITSMYTLSTVRPSLSRTFTFIPGSLTAPPLLQAMHPTTVALLVITQHSIINIFGFGPPPVQNEKPAAVSGSAGGGGARPATAGHLSFARPTTLLSGTNNTAPSADQSSASAVSSIFDGRSEKGAILQDDAFIDDDDRVMDEKKQTRTAPF
ncbi:hypothetical protein D9615_006842 [Tricholomella constricta]|uniref:Uncharacterized protein n=1 Tax=Tricholomella constricta TaxID=117010 RepID=A0A8H5H8C3_9AGAR|nr:hypothetical protein D9615_006842 [Tricholomella constricta]